MRSPLDTMLACASLALSSAVAHAQLVKGYEVLEPLPGGGHRVQIPPMPISVGSSNCCRVDGNCNASARRMVESKTGLMECTEPYARPGTCLASSYDSTRLTHLWVVKSKRVRMHCQYLDLVSKCVPMFVLYPANLPHPAVQ